jgi:hypothetical protein
MEDVANGESENTIAAIHGLFFSGPCLAVRKNGSWHAVEKQQLKIYTIECNSLVSKLNH